MSKRTLAVVAADTHLRPRTWTTLRDMTGDDYFAFEQLGELAIKLHVPLILLGDIFDARLPDSESVQIFAKVCYRLQAVELDVYFVQGNHDYAEVPWPLAICPFTRHTHQQTFLLGGKRGYGLDFTPKSQLQEAIQAIPSGTDFVLMHQAWSCLQTVGTTDGDAAWFTRQPLVLTGDYHEHLLQRAENANGQPIQFVSPGSSCLQNTGEVSDKACFLLQLDSDNQLHVESTAIPLRRDHYRFQLNSEQDLADAVQQLEQQLPVNTQLPTPLQKPLVIIKYRADLTDAFVRLQPYMGRYHMYLQTIPVRREMVVDTGVGTVTPEVIDLAYAVERLGDYTPEIAAGAKQLSQTNDPKREVAALKTEFFSNYTENSSDV